MSEDLNLNKIAAEFLGHQLDSFVETGKGVFKEAADMVRLHLDKTYKDYLRSVLKKYAKAKSFFIRSEPTYLYSFYVPLGVSLHGGKPLSHPGVGDLAKISPFCILTGLGGCGKSMFMRHLLLNAVFTSFKVPVFVELRDVNDSEKTVRDLINDALAYHKLRLDQEYVEKALQAGHFLFLLDGFDEIATGKRGAVTREIQTFVKKHDKNCVVVSSRPDPEVQGWPQFAVLQIAPLTLDLANELIEKVPYEEELKRRFQDDLRGGLFEKHESFLSNPLLLSIMLLTYGENAEIPQKLNVFYNQAYEALFQRHDAWKGGYQRERRSKLDIQDFAKVFSTLCLQTYDKGQVTFSRTIAHEYLEKSKKLLHLEFNTNDFIDDALRAVCLLVEDGLSITFAHRSFQEYFVAQFLAGATSSTQEKLLKKYSNKANSDNVLKLLYEIKPESVVLHYILPGLHELLTQIGASSHDGVGINEYLKYVRIAYASFTVDQESVWGNQPKGPELRYGTLVAFTLTNCGDLISWKGFVRNNEATDAFVKKYAKKNQHVDIDSNSLKSGDEFLQDLAEHGGLFSMETLTAALQVTTVLEQRLRTTEITLEEAIEL
jgi:hypothetical protein